ncbi:unnamed protein product [Commensalibacter communis]|uniref:hypothetical protein n=1 Tax=Commensalibacter communis TaxID=2972786 RepID=UPI0022FFB0F1|nr:hypothetical protein [Commensalibacter communis]CAI3952860.1 unnamed protein product [Commensalibacter communis]CAI3960797.1 unnamed protein product [Commensalibacter communis]
MDKLKNLAAKMEQREILRHKIYKVCYQYLNPKSDKELTSDIISALKDYDISDLSELEAPDLMHQAGNAIDLPYEIIYCYFPYSDYYECDDPKPINIKIFADVFIELFEAYHAQWQRFKELPKQKQDAYYNKIYNVIENFTAIKDVAASSDSLINRDELEIDGYKAKRMIKTALWVTGLEKRMYGAFHPYFKFLTVWNDSFIGIFFIGLSSLCLYVGTLWSIIFGVFFLFFGLMHFFNRSTVSEPLTVKEFADKIVGLRLMQSYQDTQHSKGQHND